MSSSPHSKGAKVTIDTPDDGHIAVAPPNRGTPNLTTSSSPTHDLLTVAAFQPSRASLSTRALATLAAFVLVLMLLCAAIAYGVASMGTEIHGARSEVYYQITDAQPTGFLRQDRTLSTQLVALKSRDVLGPVAAANGLSVDALMKKVHASVLSDSEVMQVEVDDPSASRAETLVGAVVSQYLTQARAQNSTSAQAYLRSQLSALDARRRDLTTQASQLEQQRQARASSSNPNPAQSAAQIQVQSELTSLFDQRQSLQSQLDSVTVAQLNQPKIEQLTKPYLLDSPVSPKPLRAAAAGALVGLLAAGFAVAWMVRQRAVNPNG
jgi:capsular polysaccharide biosynthesis protein